MILAFNGSETEKRRIVAQLVDLDPDPDTMFARIVGVLTGKFDHACLYCAAKALGCTPIDFTAMILAFPNALLLSDYFSIAPPKSVWMGQGAAAIAGALHNRGHEELYPKGSYGHIATQLLASAYQHFSEQTARAATREALKTRRGKHHSGEPLEAWAPGEMALNFAQSARVLAALADDYPLQQLSHLNSEFTLDGMTRLHLGDSEDLDVNPDDNAPDTFGGDLQQALLVAARLGFPQPQTAASKPRAASKGQAEPKPSAPRRKGSLH